MKAKSSVKYASPKARSGKGEGAREYLGDILM
jgi:indole-3-glycerol phosphate synthase